MLCKVNYQIQSTFLNLNTIWKFQQQQKKKSDPSTSSKYYWTLWKTLLNGRKIPCIPPYFHNNKFITDFKERKKTFNSFFVKQCSLVDNGSTLPSLFPLITKKSLSGVDSAVKDIKNIINKLDSNKAHSDDMISIRMINPFVNHLILSSNFL